MTFAEDRLFEINRISQDSWQMFRMLGELAIGFDKLKTLPPLSDRIWQRSHPDDR